MRESIALILFMASFTCTAMFLFRPSLTSSASLNSLLASASSAFLRNPSKMG